MVDMVLSKDKGCSGMDTWGLQENNTVKSVIEWKPLGMSPRGIPRKRWIDLVEEDQRKMEMDTWRDTCQKSVVQCRISISLSWKCYDFGPLHRWVYIFIPVMINIDGINSAEEPPWHPVHNIYPHRDRFIVTNKRERFIIILHEKLCASRP